MTENKTRYDFIDNAKGLALLIVISWHCHWSVFPHPVFSQWVLPCFFIIMGVFYKQSESLHALLVKKTNGLLLPWVIYSLPAVILGLLNVKGFDLNKIYNPYVMILGPCWFLVCMFWCYWVYWYLNRIACKMEKCKNVILLLLCFLVFTFSWSLNYINIMGKRVLLPFFLSAACTCITFVGIGSFLKSIFLDTKLYSIRNLIFLTLCIFICAISIAVGGGLSFNPMWNQTDQSILWVIPCSTAGSYIALQICKAIPNIFIWIGKNTIPFLCMHYFPILILHNYYPNTPPYKIFICGYNNHTFYLSNM